jgi:S-adenosyl-L-methionine hydrolase (adenosine-forming)
VACVVALNCRIDSASSPSYARLESIEKGLFFPVSRILTLLTDFGTRDAYVASMKGVILGINPDLRTIDITHEVPPQDVMEAAFVLKEALPFFPEDAIHLCVVDPGVGTARRPVAVRAGQRIFIGPDNGLFPLALGDAVDEAVVLDNPEYWRQGTPSNTFHGRDIFAPVAAYLSTGVSLQQVGSPVTALTPMHWALPIVDDKGIRGWVIHIDRFGNCITNIDRSILDQFGAPSRVKCFAGNTILTVVSSTYGDVEPGEPLLLLSSGDYLEVAVNGGNAAELLGIRKGAAVNLLFLEPRPS